MQLKKLKCVSDDIDICAYLEQFNLVKSYMVDSSMMGNFDFQKVKNFLSDGAKIWMFYQGDKFVCSMMFIPSSQEIIDGFGLELKSSEVGECGPIFVHPDYRGRGLQKQMLLFLNKYCRDLGYKTILTTIHPKNDISIQNFEESGYYFVSKIKLKRGERNLYLKDLKASKNIKYVFLEGLPGVGKTTICKTIEKLNDENIKVVNEIVYLPIMKKNCPTEDDFIENDRLKIVGATGIKNIIDRGPISSLSYSELTKELDSCYNLENAINSFEKYKKILRENSRIIYLKSDESNLRLSGKTNRPYGTVENLEKLEVVTINNIKQYCNNYVIIKYYKDELDDIIDEIIS